MLRKTIALSAALLALPCILSGANIRWDYLDGDVFPHEREGVDGSKIVGVTIGWPIVSINGPVSGDAVTLWAETYTVYMEFGSSVCIANAGDVASVESITAKDLYFFYGPIWVHPEDDDKVRTDYSITLERGESVYLEFLITYNSIPNKEVGWFELAYGMDGNLGVVRSAIDTDGDPLVVGYIIPEPTGGTLLLLGAAALLLRRRKSERDRSRRCEMGI